MNISNKKVKDAVQSLILSHPFFAGILIQQKFEECNDPEVNPTFSVDGETFRFNSTFADSLTFDECKGVCAHEACHLAGLHHTRQGSRKGKRWNKACDFAINPRLIRDGFKLPAGCLNDPKFADMSAEDIYRALPDDPEDNPQAGNGKPSANPCGQVLPAKGKDAKAIEAKTKTQIEKAVSFAKAAGQMSADNAREIARNVKPRFDWREVLHRFFQEMTARDYSFAVPNKRFAHTGIILPSLRSRDIGRIVLAIDTSGSVSAAEVSAMVAEMQNCLESYCENGIAQPLTVIYCDAEIKGIETLESGDQAHPIGGGGTEFAPVFAHLGNDLDEAACLVYLTDGLASDLATLPSLAPSFPVLWGLIRDNDSFTANPPFGECVKVDVAA